MMVLMELAVAVVVLEKLVILMVLDTEEMVHQIQ